jgi:predicted DNA repair protein MutK
MTKVAAKKTAGLLSDDLAVNAQQVSGVRAERELPVVWAVAKGSLLNKVILVPAALAISAISPVLVGLLLILGGLYLCLEGVENIVHHFWHGKEGHDEDAETRLMKREDVDLVAMEKEKIRGAIRTDFVLSAEIIVIALSTVQEASFGFQVAVVSSIALIMTIGVYGVVAGIVKLDDLGLHLLQSHGESGLVRLKRTLGNGLLWFAPRMMKSLTVIGTVAMFLVGGGILAHGIGPLHHWLEGIHHSLAHAEGLTAWLAVIWTPLANAALGILAGILVLLLLTGARRLWAFRQTMVSSRTQK